MDSDPGEFKYRARNFITTQIARGILKSASHLSCEMCGVNREIYPRCQMQWHHPDYQKPAEVICLCSHCHMKLHGKMGTWSKRK